MTSVASLRKEHAAAELQLERARILLLQAEVICERDGVEPPDDLLGRLRRHVRDCEVTYEHTLVSYTDALTPQYLRRRDKSISRARRWRAIPLYRGRSRPRARRRGGQRHATKRQSGVSPPDDDDPDEASSSPSSTRSGGGSEGSRSLQPREGRS